MDICSQQIDIDYQIQIRNVNNLIKLNQEIKKLYTYFFLLGCIGAAATVILIISIAKMF